MRRRAQASPDTTATGEPRTLALMLFSRLVYLETLVGVFGGDANSDAVPLRGRPLLFSNNRTEPRREGRKGVSSVSADTSSPTKSSLLSSAAMMRTTTVPHPARQASTHSTTTSFNPATGLAFPPCLFPSLTAVEADVVGAVGFAPVHPADVGDHVEGETHGHLELRRRQVHLRRSRGGDEMNAVGPKAEHQLEWLVKT